MRILSALLILGTTTAVMSPVPVLAEEKAAIGYVDMRKLIGESKAGKKIRAELEKLRNDRVAKLQKEEEKLKELQQAFEKEKLVMTEEQKKQKQKEFQEKLQAYQRNAAEAQQEVQKRDAELAQQEFPVMRKIIAEVAQEEKLILVFDRGQVPALYAADGPDLTDKVLKRYDAQTKK